MKLLTKCLSSNYSNGYVAEGAANGYNTFNASVTFVDTVTPSNVIQLTFNNLTELLPYLPGKLYDLEISPTSTSSSGS